MCVGVCVSIRVYDRFRVCVCLSECVTGSECVCVSIRVYDRLHVCVCVYQSV